MTAQAAIVAISQAAPQLTSALSQDQLDEVLRLWADVSQPISEADVRILLTMLPADGDLAFEVNWTLLHAIERSLCWPLWDALSDENDWHRRLKLLLANAGIHSPA
ncbi:hypothetical protein [Candidatus Viadribacter manganicus]|uniref:Uncharacterized protein n=1 Tax=Candidatus Viadribacter manganicus TaxID=1759059 RepID=A0A1B1AHU1_9PROT|nr:hypothetical protein [Candidatus Viadribacter manganicus]ANP46128.1 hypothetical protein ATE48_09445 [Candidatus Viadribacter manganicus]